MANYVGIISLNNQRREGSGQGMFQKASLVLLPATTRLFTPTTFSTESRHSVLRIQPYSLWKATRRSHRQESESSQLGGQ
eukprot:gene17135-18853_t